MTTLRKACAALAVGVAATLAISSPAIAAAPSSCPSGYACIWEDADYKTDGLSSRVIKFEYKIYEMDTFSYYWLLTFHWGGNNGSSIYNNGVSYGTRWYDGEYFTGTGYYTMSKNNGINSLVNAGWNDKIDSACFTSNCS